MLISIALHGVASAESVQSSQKVHPFTSSEDNRPYMLDMNKINVLGSQGPEVASWEPCSNPNRSV